MTTAPGLADQTAPVRSFTYICQIDNYDPPRERVIGAAEVYLVPGTDTESLVLLEAFEKFMDPHKSLFLVDDGQTVEPFYVTGWQLTPGAEFEGCVFLRRFPLSVGTRPDNGRPIDMSGWMLGPRRCYHLKVKT